MHYKQTTNRHLISKQPRDPAPLASAAADDDDESQKLTAALTSGKYMRGREEIQIEIMHSGL